MNVPYVTEEGRQLVAPLLLGTEVLGAAVLVGVEPREDLMRFVGQATSQLAIAVANVRAYAEAGVDYISVGSLTHSARSVDMSMKIVPA